jgi:GNAT superfamily N-acetyltransferase
MMKIITIDEKSNYLAMVIELGDANSKTLGFLKESVFREFATRRQILVALDENEEFLGYLLYAINQTKRETSIVHLCVKNFGRRKGVAKMLFEKLKNQTKEFFRIRVHCRRDFEAASKVWEKLGFVAMGEKPGRSKQGSTLTVWWFEHGHPTLFTRTDEQRSPAKLRVVIDANIFYDLQDTPKTENQKESHSLLAGWLNLELCLTKETYNEINRSENIAKRRHGRNIADTAFQKLSSSEDDFQKSYGQLCQFFLDKRSVNDESDLRQLAWSDSAPVQFFVTHDKVLLNKAEEIYEHLRMHIIEPSYLITHQDELMREHEYQPARLAGQIKIGRVKDEQISQVEHTFLLKQEKKSKFKEVLQPFLSNPRTFETKIVQSNGQLLALVIYGRNTQDELEIPIFRLVPNSLSATLARFLVLRIVLDSSLEQRVLTRITQPLLSEELMDALQEHGFILTDNCWIKANISIVDTTTVLASKLTIFSQRLLQAKQYFQELAKIIEEPPATTGNTQRLLNVEKSLWPAKISDIDMPAFMVPIRADWAMQLFDFNIASQDLFGGEPSLLLNVENVYYRACHPSPRNLTAPARILWYVSRGTGNYQGGMSIRACSYLDEIIVDKPKTIFSRFRRLGVYQWPDIFKVANENLDQEIMAFRFSRTEVFNNPLGKDELASIWLAETGQTFHPPQNPRFISNSLFFRLYKMGTQTQMSSKKPLYV